MPFPPNRPPRSNNPSRDRDYDRPRDRDVDPGLRDLLTFLRDTFRDAATRIDRYLGPGAAASSHASHAAPPARGDWRDRAAADEDDDTDHYDDRPRGGSSGNDTGTRMPLEALRDEARKISSQAGEMDPAELRLRVEAVTAETRSLQNRASDPEDADIAAKILRALTAIVSEYRPGHVYGLARHHEADWDEVGRRAREELAGRGGEK